VGGERYDPVGSFSAGSAGRTFTDLSGQRVTIPAGALSETLNLEVYRESPDSEEDPSDPNTIASDLYVLTGLSAVVTHPIEVSIPLTGEVSEESYLVVEYVTAPASYEAGAVYRAWLPVTLDGGRAIARIPLTPPDEADSGAPVGRASATTAATWDRPFAVTIRYHV
jgi:hypothetical protein